MNDINKRKVIKSVLISGIIGIGLYSFATASRKVSIPLQISSGASDSNNGIDLHNGSAVAVNYNITCYDKSGSPTFAKSAITLNPKASITHAGPVKCADNTVANKYDFLNNMVACSSTDYANAASKCASGYTMCSLTEFKNNLGSSSGWSTFWVNFSSEFGGAISTSSGASNNFQYSYDGINWYNMTGNYIIAGYQNASYKCRASSGSTEYGNCNGNWVSPTSWYSVACCPTAGANIELPSNSCDVEILSTTPASGYLQSPQFKGSAAF